MKFQFLKMTKKGTFFLQELNWGWQQQWGGWTGVEWEDLAAGKVVTIAVWNSIIKIFLFYSKKELGKKRDQIVLYLDFFIS